MDQRWADELAIQELCARYCHTIDSQDSDDWADCFTPEGVFEFDGWPIKAREALREHAEVHTRFMRCRHMTVNHLYEVEGDSASGTSTTVVTVATEGGSKILGQSAYFDALIRRGEDWLFVTRLLTTDRLVANPEKAVNLADPDVAALVSHLVEAARRLGSPVAK
jgi:hypothetical protein